MQWDDTAIIQTARERTEHLPAEVHEGLAGGKSGTELDDGPAELQVMESAWATWLGFTNFMMKLGFSTNTLCEGANQLASVRSEYAAEKAEHQTA